MHFPRWFLPETMTNAPRISTPHFAIRGARGLRNARGRGSYRIADRIDFDAVRSDPKSWSASATSRSCI